MPDLCVMPGHSSNEGCPFSLSNQQKAVLSLAAQGLTAREIARRLSLSVWTVRHYSQEAYIRLGARSQAHAVAIALSHKLIDSVTVN